MREFDSLSQRRIEYSNLKLAILIYQTTLTEWWCFVLFFPLNTCLSRPAARAHDKSLGNSRRKMIQQPLLAPSSEPNGVAGRSISIGRLELEAQLAFATGAAEFAVHITDPFFLLPPPAPPVSPKKTGSREKKSSLVLQGPLEKNRKEHNENPKKLKKIRKKENRGVQGEGWSSVYTLTYDGIDWDEQICWDVWYFLKTNACAWWMHAWLKPITRCTPVDD